MAQREKSNHCKICGKYFFLKSCFVTHKLKHKNEVDKDNILAESTDSKDLAKSADGKDLAENTGYKDLEVKERVECDSKKGNVFSEKNDADSKKDGKKFSCEVCHKQFNLRSSFKTHLISHKVVEPNVCVLCKKTFNAQHYFRAHMVKHARGEIIQCSVCKLWFFSKARYLQHLNAAHNSSSPKKKKKAKRQLKDDVEDVDYVKNENTLSDILYDPPLNVQDLSCNICYEVFSERNLLDKHFQEHKDNLDCKECAKKFANIVCLRRHMKAHGWKANTLCEKCGKVVRTRTYKQHLLMHSGERPYKCPDCCEAFNQRSHLNRHVKYHYRDDEHPDGNCKLFRCEHCSVSFFRAYRLRQHMALHSDPYPKTSYQCYICNQSYLSKGTLRHHFKSHLGKTPFECWFCPEAFSRSMALFRHEKTHYPIEFTCHLCPENFSSSARLYAHYTGHSDEELQQLDPNLLLMIYERKLNCTNCNVCGKNVRTTFLKFHMMNHSEKKFYNCPLCSKTFTTSQSVKIHLRLHSGERPFACDICNKTFSQRGHLNVHLALHSNVKRYLCRFCGKAFATQNYVSNHEKRHCKGNREYGNGSDVYCQENCVREKENHHKSNYPTLYSLSEMVVKEELVSYNNEYSTYVDEGDNKNIIPSIECVPEVVEDGEYGDRYEETLVLKIEGDMFPVAEEYEQ